MHAVLLLATRHFYKLLNNKDSMFSQQQYGVHWKRHVHRCSTTRSPPLYALPTRSYDPPKLECSFCRILYLWPRQCNDGYKNASHCYVTRTLSVLLAFSPSTLGTGIMMWLQHSVRRTADRSIRSGPRVRVPVAWVCPIGFQTWTLSANLPTRVVCASCEPAKKGH